MITSAQCRAGRALIGWSQQDLADRAGVGLSTVKGFETGRTDPNKANLEAIMGALEQSGVMFISETLSEGPGVRLRKDAGLDLDEFLPIPDIAVKCAVRLFRDYHMAMAKIVDLYVMGRREQPSAPWDYVEQRLRKMLSMMHRGVPPSKLG